MKVFSLFLGVCAILIGSSSAATIAVGRGIGNPGAVAAVEGSALSTGGYYFAMGTFTNTTGVTEVPVITDTASLMAARDAFDVFSALASPTSGATIGTLTGNFSGLGGADPSVFNLKPIYFLVGNAATLANSTYIGIFRITGSADFPANVQGATGPSLTLSSGASITAVAGAGSVTGNNFNLVAIPEPSVALLGLLGAVGLIRRRR
ncbi:MAG: hypothetical protein EOP83_14405 [Verrucomicrobiaceae bacterium]|nr:MAG: hypothetical protein EOP83_14405 [Verrucomicrobiaceae bacterium]